jgi:hypothetical protein
MIPTLYLRVAAYALVAVLAFGCGWKVQGWRKDSQIADIAADAQAARDDARARARAAEEAQAASQAFAEALAVEREAKTQIVEKEITRNVIKYVQKPSSQSKCLDSDGVRLHNASAAGRVSEDAGTTSKPDAGATGATAASVVSTVTDNYATCHANANQLRALQDWVRALNPQVQ